MKSKKVLIAVFLVIIFLPMLGAISGMSTGTLAENKGGSKNEPDFKRKVFSFIKNYDGAFWGRHILIKAYIWLKKDIFKTSPLPEKLVIGQGNWLYLADHGAMDDCRNLHPFSNPQLDSITRYLNGIGAVLNANKVKFYVAVVPDKHTIYPEYLPAAVKKINPYSRLQDLTRHLQGQTLQFNFIDLTDTLLHAKRIEQVYYNEESHWNDAGAFAGYQQMVSRMRHDFPTINWLSKDSCFRYEGEEQDIDLAKLLGEDISYSEKCIRLKPVSIQKNYSVPHNYVIPEAKEANVNFAYRSQRDDIAGPKIVIYRDSYFEALTPFFASSFPQATFIWTTEPNVPYAIQEGAEIVLLEVAERHLYLLTK